MAVGPHEHRTQRLKLIKLGPITPMRFEVSAGANGIDGERNAKLLRRRLSGRAPDFVLRSCQQHELALEKIERGKARGFCPSARFSRAQPDVGRLRPGTADGT